MSEHTPMNLPVIDCCATCAHRRGRPVHMWCGKHLIEVAAFTKCDDFTRLPAYPLWKTCDVIAGKA